MKNLERVRARYLQDPLPKRLGALAADLARVASSARRGKTGENVVPMLEESQYFIEWTAAEATPEVAAMLVEIQIVLALWRRIWPEAQKNSSQRALLAFQALKWSEQIVDFAGLL